MLPKFTEILLTLGMAAMPASANSSQSGHKMLHEEAAMSIVSAAILLSPAADGDAVAARFAALGLGAQRIGDDTILLTGPLETFQSVLATPMSMSDAGVSVGDGGATVPLSHLPDDLRQGVAEIAFETPPDFGPGNF
jgi:hypothetical protein